MRIPCANCGTTLVRIGLDWSAADGSQCCDNPAIDPAEDPSSEEFVADLAPARVLAPAA